MSHIPNEYAARLNTYMIYKVLCNTYLCTHIMITYRIEVHSKI